MKDKIKHIEASGVMAICDAMGTGVSIQDTDFVVLYQNTVHKDLIGDHIGEYCYKAYEKREAVCEGCPLSSSFKKGGVHKAERTSVTDKGGVIVEITASVLRNSAGENILGIEVVRDITESKANERKLLEKEKELLDSENRYRMLFNGITDSVFVHGITDDDMPGRFLAVNDVACRQLGYTREELLKMSPRDIDDPASMVDVRPIGEKLKRGESVIFQQTHIARDGRRIPVEIHVRSFVMQAQTLTLSVVRDISERKKTDEDIKKKMRELEEFYEIAVNRELRMKELKEEISILKAKLEEFQR